MNALANMLAKQKAKAEEGLNGNTTSSNAAAAVDSAVGGAAGATDSVVASKPAGRLTFGVKKPAAIPSPAEVTATKIESVPQVSDGVMSLDDLNDSEDQGATHSSTTSGMAFEDEIPCLAPARELPEDITTQQLAFVQQLDSIYQIVHDPELFGNMIRTIMQELQEVPDYMKLMADQDVHVMIRGLRSSMGLAKIKKAEKSTKTRASKKAPATTAMMTTADEIFSSDQW